MRKLKLITVGLAMGIAEVIPGVSGGTIAFITGIYQELIDTIKGFKPSLIIELRSKGFRYFWNAINGNFLLFLLAGMVIGIGIGISTITYFLEHYPEPLWSLFFGLIIASSVYIGRQIDNWNIAKVLLLILAGSLSYYITIISPVTGSSSLIYVFISGAIAISALILPGISGSFILLLMGMYFVIIPEIKLLLTAPNFNSLKILIVFGLGCLTGLALFSRVLSWTFKNYKNETLVILTGFIIGSLNKIWPWRICQELVIKDTGEHVFYPESLNMISQLDPKSYKVLTESNVLPSNYDMGDPKVLLASLAFVIGLTLVFLLARLDKQTN